MFLTGKLLSQTAFISYPKSSGKISELLTKVEDSLKKQFEERKLQWPPEQLYLRSFKYDRQLEVWVKEDDKGTFKLFKAYKVCMQSGTMGPKRLQGD